MAKRKNNSLVLFLLLGLNCLLNLSASFASDWVDEPGSASGKKFFLQGKIEHSSHLSALDTDLQSGQHFTESKLSQARYASKWFQIPEWFAGTFQVDESIITSMEDCVNGRISHPKQIVPSYGQEQHGFQRDNNNDIWHYYVESGISKSEQSRQITYNNIDWYGPIQVSKKRIVMRILATSLIVDKQTGTIIDSYRREDLKIYEPASANTMRVSYTSKSFDSYGNARDLQSGFSIHRRISPFQAIDRSGDTDYRQLFQDYLIANGMKNLLPKL